MKYKLLIFDLDGTAIPNKSTGIPTKNLVDVISHLQKTMKVCAATGRPWFNSKPIIRKLGLTDPCIISGGTQIINPITEKILWEKLMDRDQVKDIMEVALPYKVDVFFSDDKKSTSPKEKIVSGPERIVYIENVNKANTDAILKKISKIRGIVAHEVQSWTPNYFDVHITHVEATKKHSLEVLLEMLDIEKNEVIAAGDSNNDLPLFELSGYKIAMENGIKELKNKADFIAGNADEDGLAIALTKPYGPFK